MIIFAIYLISLALFGACSTLKKYNEVDRQTRKVLKPPPYLLYNKCIVGDRTYRIVHERNKCKCYMLNDGSS